MTTSPPDRGRTRLRFGKIGRAHGVRGEVRLFTDDPDSQTPALIDALELELPDGQRRRFEIVRARLGQRFWIVSLQGVRGRDAAEALTNAVCWIEREQLPDPDDDDEIYACDLIGLRAVDADGQPLGRVVDIFDNGAHEVLVYAPDGGGPREMVPFVDEFVGDLDLEAGTLELTPLVIDDDDETSRKRPRRRRRRSRKSASTESSPHSDDGAS